MVVQLSRLGIVAVMVIGLSNAAFAQNRARVYSTEVNAQDDGTTQDNFAIVRRPALYPQVAVSRALSEQPVHPHLVEVRVGGDDQMSTYVDPTVPMRRRPGETQLDDGHTLTKIGMRVGVTTSALNAASAARRHLRNAPDMYGSNRARVIRPNAGRSMMYADYDTARPRMYIPVNRPAPQRRVPVPRPAKPGDITDGQVASAAS